MAGNFPRAAALHHNPYHKRQGSKNQVRPNLEGRRNQGCNFNV
jgi:hypothetical protein